MRVVINGSMALGPRTGIGHYTAELLRCLHEQAPGSVAAFPQGWLRRAARAGARARAALVRTNSPSADPAPSGLRGRLQGCARTLTRCWGLEALAQCFRLHCTVHRYQVYHEPNFIPLPSDLPTVVTVHDLSVLHNPAWHPVDRAAYFEKHFQRGLSRCQHVLAISEFGRQEVIRTLGIPADRVTRTYMGIRPGLGPLPRAAVAATLQQLGLPANYLLYLGTLEPRKNALTLLRAYCALPAPLRQRWPLVLVGGWGWGADAVARFLHDEARHRGVLHLGYVDNRHVPVLYNGARALLYPSHYEGFGLPPVEMLACGGAVLASTAGAVAETVGGRAYLIHPDDGDGWRAAMQRVVTDDDWCQSLRKGAQEAAQPFTWEQCAADTLQVYRRLCGIPAARPPAEPIRKAG
jgi:glycosyltransferase involved in cell wall biosynthesis